MLELRTARSERAVSFMTRKKTTEQAIAESIEYHGDRFDYSQTVYNGAHAKMTVICKQHGLFKTKLSTHLALSGGCQGCIVDEKRSRLKLPLDECISRLNNKYENFYDYSLLDYNNTSDKVDVICPEHGKFKVVLSHHLNRGDRCPECAKRGRSVYNETIFQRNPELAQTMGYFYVIKLEHEDEVFYKYGMTKNDVKTRYRHSGTGPYKRTVILEEKMSLYDAFLMEQEYKNTEPYVPKYKFDGYTECRLNL